MSVHRTLHTVTASSSLTVAFGKIYQNCSFSVHSGTGSGAIKVGVVGAGGTQYINPSPNRVPLLAGSSPYKVVDYLVSGVRLWSSGTATTAVILVNAWGEAT